MESLLQSGASDAFAGSPQLGAGSVASVSALFRRSVSAFWCEIANSDAGCFGVSAFAPNFLFGRMSLVAEL